METKFRLRLICFLCMLLSFAFLSAEEEDDETENTEEQKSYYFEKNGDEVKFIQILRWETNEYALYYEIEIQKKASLVGVGTETQKIETEADFIEVSLTPGDYRYRVTAYNILAKPETTTEWKDFTVLNAVQPAISNVGIKTFYYDETPTLEFDIKGLGFFDETQIYIVNKETGSRYKPLNVTFNEKRDKMTLYFGRKNIQLGYYAVYVENEGGLNDTEGDILIDFLKPVDFNVSAGYAPYVYFYSEGVIDKYFEKIFFPFGLNLNLQLVPVKRSYGYWGIELNSAITKMKIKQDFYDLSTFLATSHLNLVFQKMLIHKKLVLNAKIGGGLGAYFSCYLDYGMGLTSERFNTITWSLDGGLSLQYYFTKDIFADLGVRYIYNFAENMPSQLINPSLTVGWRF